MKNRNTVFSTGMVTTSCSVSSTENGKFWGLSSPLGFFCVGGEGEGSGTKMTSYLTDLQG